MKVWTSLLALAAAFALATPTTAQPPRNEYEQAAIAAVQAHLDVYRSWDLDAFVDTFSKDALVMLDGRSSRGHAQIRALYASNFADEPHAVEIVSSGIRRGMVYTTAAYTFADGYQRCCTEARYYVKDGKIAFLTVKMTKRPQGMASFDDD